METVKRWAFDPETGHEYEIELPSREELKTALLKLDYPEGGISNRAAADRLAEYFSLTDRQKNAQSTHKNHFRIFLHDVGSATGALAKSGQLIRPRNYWITKPERPSESLGNDNATSTSAVAVGDRLVDDRLSPALEESIDTNYQQIQNALAADLLQRIKDNSPAFFEELVIDLLVAMGYGGSREEAGRAVGGRGDGGIDGVINEDILGLDVIYVQAKRWQGNVGEPPVRDFVWALQGRRARKGIFITTSDFTREARDYVTTIETKIVLIDGRQLAQFMIDNNVGVSVVKSYEIKRVDSDYFAEEGE